MTVALDIPRRLNNPVMPYVWGSHIAIAQLCGRRVPSSAPEAELWMGAHPKAPSTVTIDGEDIGLDKLIARRPNAILGEQVAGRFDGRLPFLFKVLAAEKPLSIQAHPDRKQAIEGYERENRAAIPLDAPQRNYRDDNHKPEIIVALTAFWGLNGFRPLDDLECQLDRFGPKGLLPLWSGCCAASSPSALDCFFDRLMGLTGSAKEIVLAEALDNARRYANKNPIGAWVQTLQTAYPGDIGTLAPIFLNLVRLEPGQAMYLPARQLHAYLNGVGIELMANSDNVLRGGLTSKHIDPRELMRVLRFDMRAATIVTPQVFSATETLFPTPAEEFQLARIDLRERDLHQASGRRGVEILIVTEGALSLHTEGRAALHLVRGESVLVPAAAEPYRLVGRGVCYRAGVPASVT